MVYMTASSNWESWSGESGNLLWRSGTVSWASLTLNWLSPARARHPRWHSPSLSVFPTFCWMWDNVTKGKSCRNQHILIQLSPPSMSLTTLPQPNRDLFFDWRCRWPHLTHPTWPARSCRASKIYSENARKFIVLDLGKWYLPQWLAISRDSWSWQPKTWTYFMHLGMKPS